MKCALQLLIVIGNPLRSVRIVTTVKLSKQRASLVELRGA